MDNLFAFVQKNWNSVSVGMAALFALYLAHKEVWVFGTASRREIAAERKIAELLAVRVKQLEHQLVLCQQALERAQNSMLRSNLIAERTVQMAEALREVVENPDE